VSVAAWVAIGWLGVTLTTALGARLGVSHVMPDAAVVTIVFLAFRRHPAQVVLVALALGYLSGRQALAPVGLHEVALILCALTVYFGAGNLAGSGARFFALTSGGAVMLYHLLVYLLASSLGGRAHFAGWGTATLLPTGLITALLALVAEAPMAAIERRLSPSEHEELSWH